MAQRVTRREFVRDSAAITTGLAVGCELVSQAAESSATDLRLLDISSRASCHRLSVALTHSDSALAGNLGRCTPHSWPECRETDCVVAFRKVDTSLLTAAAWLRRNGRPFLSFITGALGTTAMTTFSIRSFVLLVAATAIGSWGWATDTQLRARLESEAPKAWSQIAALADRLDIQVRVTWATSKGDTEFLNQFKFAGSSRLLSSTTTKIPPGETVERLGEAKVLAENPKYAFHIQKYDETRPWLLAHLGEPSKDFLEQIDEGAYSYARFQLSVGDLYLPDVFGKPTFKILDGYLFKHCPTSLRLRSSRNANSAQSHVAATLFHFCFTTMAQSLCGSWVRRSIVRRAGALQSRQNFHSHFCRANDEN
ncbi:MAG: hypothetical protein HY288_19275 [Planctomycetia bacterium]|nr:hypothetical protein [Planctomycetia bacterium]